MALRVLHSEAADVPSYSEWASTIAAQDSTIDKDGNLSATHSIACLLQTFARGEPFHDAWRGSTLLCENMTFVEYRVDDQLTGLLLADITAAPILIHRVLVTPECRSDGPRRPTPSVMTVLAHALISHAMDHRSSGTSVGWEFQLADLPCVVAHKQKWMHVFRTYERVHPCGRVEIVDSLDPKQSPKFVLHSSPPCNSLCGMVDV